MALIWLDALTPTPVEMTAKAKPTARKVSSAAKLPVRAHVPPPALTGWLLSQRKLGDIDPTAAELARAIKRSLFSK